MKSDQKNVFKKCRRINPSTTLQLKYADLFPLKPELTDKKQKAFFFFNCTLQY